MSSKTMAKEMMAFIHRSKTAFHGAKEMACRLKDAGFVELDKKQSWSVKKGDRFFVREESALLAFRVDTINEGFRIVASHLDSPGIKIKPNPIISENGFVKLNVEMYGGLILNTWLDRPLSLAGRCIVKSESVFQPIIRLVDFQRPLVIIPNLAIHQNRDVNKGVELNRQKHMLPILSLDGTEVSAQELIVRLAKHLNVRQEDILDFELFLHDAQEPCFVGFDDEFISSPRLDNLVMAWTSMEALVRAPEGRGISVVAAFDHEEVGSETAQGADSSLLSQFLQRIDLALGHSPEQYLQNLAKSLLISGDMAHGIHPNVPEKSDPTNRVFLGKGPVIKVSTNKNYTSDAVTFAIFTQLCKEQGIPVQTFVNRSDEAGGSTVGPCLASRLCMASVDIGAPMLAMHSIRELMSTLDPQYTYKALSAFYGSKQI